MRKKQSSSKLQTFAYIMLILASVVIISCGAYFLYEKYEAHKQTEEKNSVKKTSTCFEDELCFYLEYKLIDNVLYYELVTLSGLQNVKEKYKKYYKDSFAEDNHKIKWKDYFKKEDKPDTLVELLKTVYIKEFDIDKLQNVYEEVGFSNATITLSFNTNDGLQLDSFSVIGNNTAIATNVVEDYRVSLTQTQKINLKKQIAENLSYIYMGWSRDFRESVKKNF